MDLTGIEMRNKIPAGGIIPCRFSIIYGCRGAKAPPLIPTNCFVLRTPTLLSNIRLSRNLHPRSIPIPCTKKAATHATKHCQSTTAMAHFPPSSLRTEAMAATQGVYSRLNTSNDAAASGVSTVRPSWNGTCWFYGSDR